MRFGDGSIVNIYGLGSVVNQGKQNQHKVLTRVYYIPQLKSNIVSLGQLEEAGCDIRLFDGRLNIYDADYSLLVCAPRTNNRLYIVKLGIVPPVCLMTKIGDTSWRWHARYEHLDF